MNLNLNKLVASGNSWRSDGLNQFASLFPKIDDAVDPAILIGHDTFSINMTVQPAFPGALLKWNVPDWSSIDPPGLNNLRLERSSDNSDWTQIQSFTNTVSQLPTIYTDPFTNSGIWYYRLTCYQNGVLQGTYNIVSIITPFQLTVTSSYDPMRGTVNTLTWVPPTF